MKQKDKKQDKQKDKKQDKQKDKNVDLIELASHLLDTLA